MLTFRPKRLIDAKKAVGRQHTVLKDEQPTYRELDPKELNEVSGGVVVTSPEITEIVITKRMDKASTKLF